MSRCLVYCLAVMLAVTVSSATSRPTTTMPTPYTYGPTTYPSEIPTERPTTAMPTTLPTTATPTSSRPTTAMPTVMPTTPKPTTSKPTPRPTPSPTASPTDRPTLPPVPSCVETAGFFKRYLNGQWSASSSSAYQFDRKIKIRWTTWDYKLWLNGDDKWKISYLKKGKWKDHLRSCSKDDVLDCDGSFSLSSPWVKFHDCSVLTMALRMDSEWFSDDGVDTQCFDEGVAHAAMVRMTGLHSVLDDVDDDDTTAVFETEWCWNGKPLYVFTLSSVYDDEDMADFNATSAVDVIPVMYMLQWTGIEWAIAENELISVAVDDEHYYGYNQRIAFCEESALADCVAHTWIARYNFSAIAADEQDSDVVYQYQLNTELAVVTESSEEDKVSKLGLIVGVVCGALFLLALSVFCFRFYAARRALKNEDADATQYQPMIEYDEQQIAMT